MIESEWDPTHTWPRGGIPSARALFLFSNVRAFWVSPPKALNPTAMYRMNAGVEGRKE